MNPSRFTLMAVLAVSAPLAAMAQNNAPVVSNVTAAQRGDASKLVDIHYDLADADNDPCSVWMTVSNDSGTTWSVLARTLSGDYGAGITPGANKSVVWDAGADIPGKVGNYKVRVFADDGLGIDSRVLVPAGYYLPNNNISESTFVDHFYIDKYETTNVLYCQFLNNADPTGTHWDVNQEIDRWGSQPPFAFSVRPGKDNYPIRYVSYNDAVAYAAWRSTQTGRTYRLPTMYEWEKVAAWDPVEGHYYQFGCHQETIDCAWCNFKPGPYCVGTTSPVGYFDGTAGTNSAKSYYGCYDMSGNLFEWTSSMSGSNHVVLGGAYSSSLTLCQCTYVSTSSSGARSAVVGFRLLIETD